MFNSRLLKEKDARISDLKCELESLRTQVASLTQALFVPRDARKIAPLTLEADAVLSGKDEQIEVSAEEMLEIEGIQSEASRILSGTY